MEQATPLGFVEKVETRALSYSVYKSLDIEIAGKYNNRTYMFLFYELLISSLFGLYLKL